MNFEICKNCMRYSNKNKIHCQIFGFNSKQQWILVGFRMLNRMHRPITARIECDDNTADFIENSRRDMSSMCFLKNKKVLECTETNGGSIFGWKVCPYQIEHFISDCSK